MDQQTKCLRQTSFSSTRSSAGAKGPRDGPPQIRNIAVEKACNREMTYKDTQGHYNCCYSTGRIQVSLAVSGLLLQHLYLAPFPRYYQFSSVCDCLRP